MNYEEKGLKEWKVIILIRMYKDSNFFFLDCWLLPFPSTLSLILSLSRSLYLSLPHSLAHSLAPPSPHAYADANSLSFFLSSSHPSIHLYHSPSNKCFIIPSPSPFFIHASISFIYTIAWPGTGSRSEGTSIVGLLLRVIATQICINDEIKSDLSNYE